MWRCLCVRLQCLNKANPELMWMPVLRSHLGSFGTLLWCPEATSSSVESLAPATLHCFPASLRFRVSTEGSWAVPWSPVKQSPPGKSRRTHDSPLSASLPLPQWGVFTHFCAFGFWSHPTVCVHWGYTWFYKILKVFDVFSVLYFCHYSKTERPRVLNKELSFPPQLSFSQPEGPRSLGQQKSQSDSSVHSGQHLSSSPHPPRVTAQLSQISLPFPITVRSFAF